MNIGGLSAGSALSNVDMSQMNSKNTGDEQACDAKRNDEKRIQADVNSKSQSEMVNLRPVANMLPENDQQISF